jgi:hypothetical protein
MPRAEPHAGLPLVVHAVTRHRVLPCPAGTNSSPRPSERSSLSQEEGRVGSHTWGASACPVCFVFFF